MAATSPGDPGRPKVPQGPERSPRARLAAGTPAAPVGVYDHFWQCLSRWVPTDRSLRERALRPDEIARPQAGLAEEAAPSPRPPAGGATG
jgi:hypothetical protein